MVKIVELDFVSEGKLRYPGINAELFGDNIQVETGEEAKARLLQKIFGKYDNKHLAEYATKLEHRAHPECLVEMIDFPNMHESEFILKKVAAELISRHQEFSDKAEAEKMAVEKEKDAKEKIKKEAEYIEYIRKLSAAREVLVKEAHDAGFSNLRSYLMFLNIFGEDGHHEGRGKIANVIFKERFGID